MGVFCVVAADRQRFRADVAYEAKHARLSIGGDKSLGEALGAQMKLVAAHVTVVIVKNSGHWILEEQPKQTTDALIDFL